MLGAVVRTQFGASGGRDISQLAVGTAVGEFDLRQFAVCLRAGGWTNRGGYRFLSIRVVVHDRSLERNFQIYLRHIDSVINLTARRSRFLARARLPIAFQRRHVLFLGNSSGNGAASDVGRRSVGVGQVKFVYFSGNSSMFKQWLSPKNRRKVSTRRGSRKLVVESLQSRQLMAADIAAIQPAIESSAEEQLMIEWINRARANPAAEAARLGIELDDGLPSGAIRPNAKQPLSLSNSLSKAAEVHSTDMLFRGYFDHMSPEGTSPSSRAIAAGYAGSAAENIALHPVTGTTAETIEKSHALLFRSPGHRQNLLDDSMEAVGIGIQIGTFGSGIAQQVQSMITSQSFGAAAEAAVITGVVYADDIVPDDFYSLGEGMANVSVIATSENGLRYETKTNSAGGYSLRLPPGSYIVIANNTAGEVAELGEVTVADRNVKLDLTEELFRGTTTNTSTNSNQTRESLLDLSGDGLVSPLDVLLVVNHINQSQPYDSRLDTNGDGFIAPLDVLLIVNYLNEQAQVSVEPDQVEYVSFDGNHYDLYSYEGRNVRLLADRADLDLSGLISWIDIGYEAYYSATGRHPNDTEQSDGKTIIARANTCGAGCGYLGQRGIEIAPRFFDEAVEEFARSGRPDHVFFYELGRNFWYYSDQLEFNPSRVDQSHRGSGDFFVNGFPVFMERAIQEFMQLDYSGYGAGADGFEESMARWFSGYLSDPSRNYYTDFAVFESSLYDDPITGYRFGTMDFLAEVLLDVARDHGGMEFVNRLWREVEQRRDWQDEVSALNNLITSASMAAGEDLTSRFRDVYKWPVNEEISLLASAEAAGLAEFQGGGLIGTYIRDYDASSVNFQRDAEQVVTRLDPEVNFEWLLGSPLKNFPSDNFAAYWEGEIFIPIPGTYKFHIYADDGVKLFIAGKTVIDAWQPQRTVLSGQITFGPNDLGPQPILLDYFEASGAATVQLSWESNFFGGIIDSAYLRPTVTI